MTSSFPISIIGAGSWGSALALTLARGGSKVLLWGHNSQQVEITQQTRINERYLPGVIFPEEITLTTSLQKASEAEIIFFVIPSKFLREIAISLKTVLDPKSHPIIVSCTKGIEHTTGKLMTEVIQEVIPLATMATLSGPNLARDIAQGLPAAGVLGCEDSQSLSRLQMIFYQTSYRVYTSNDVRGIQLGGALKNVFALATGVSDGLGMGENARAGLVTRALAEMTRLGVAMGGHHKTFSGLSGIGDLMVTCFSPQSRNYQAGLQLCEGKSSLQIQNSMTMVAEGLFTARSAQECARKCQVETPIIDAVVDLLDHGKKPELIIKELLGRRLRSEVEYI